MRRWPSSVRIDEAAAHCEGSRRSHRPAVPDLFEQDLIATFDSIAATPTIGAEYPADLGVDVRRVLMPKTRNHVYFAASGDEVVILSVWGAQRARGPEL